MKPPDSFKARSSRIRRIKRLKRWLLPGVKPGPSHSPPQRQNRLGLRKRFARTARRHYRLEHSFAPNVVHQPLNRFAQNVTRPYFRVIAFALPVEQPSDPQNRLPQQWENKMKF